MAAIVAGAEIIGELCTERGGDGDVLNEDGVLAVGVGVREGVRGDVFGDPVRVFGAPVEGGDEGEGVAEVVDGAGKAVLGYAGWVDPVRWLEGGVRDCGAGCGCGDLGGCTGEAWDPSWRGWCAGL